MEIHNSCFSFIIPVYNVGVEQIRRCVRSIEDQNLKHYEIIIVDDGSTDTKLISTLTDFEVNNQSVKLFHQKNQGSAVARNTALDVAQGEYIIFVDADDYLMPDLFSKISDDGLNADILCMDYLTKTGNNKCLCTLGDKVDLSDKKNLLYENVLYSPGALDNLMFGAIWAKCFSRGFLEKFQIRFCPELRKTQDRVFMLDVYSKAKKIVYDPIPSYIYETNGDSITHKMNMHLLKYCYSVVETVKERCVKNQIPSSCSRFFVYSIVIEMLRLTLLNSQYDKSFICYRREMKNVYKRFELDNELRSIHYSDFCSPKGKIKLLLFKHHLFVMLRWYFAKRVL